MELKALNCKNCGAQLQVPDTSNFVACRFCDSHLAICHADSVPDKEKITAPAETSFEISERLARMEYRNELDRLDAAWDEQREQYVKRDQHGREVTPNERRNGFIVIALTGVGLACIGLWSLMYVVIGGGLLLAAVSVFQFYRVTRQEREYERAHETYLINRGNVRCQDFRVKSPEQPA